MAEDNPTGPATQGPAPAPQAPPRQEAEARHPAETEPIGLERQNTVTFVATEWPMRLEIVSGAGTNQEIPVHSEQDLRRAEHVLRGLHSG
jgi:hypothetical protein